MHIKDILLLIVGILILAVSLDMINESKRHNDEYNKAVQQLKETSELSKTLIVNLHNSKCNSLSRSGALMLVYGVIVIIMSLSCVLSKCDNIFVPIILGVLGTISVVVCLSSSAISTPNPIKLS
jgi:low temperature requirement protein LtrA